MDGGRRLLRSIGELGARLAPRPHFAFAGLPASSPFPALPQTAPRLPEARRRRTALQSIVTHISGSRYLGTGLALGLLTSASAYGAWRGGEYAELVAAYGTPCDMLAKAVGFSIKSVTIGGARELSEREILSVAGVSTRNSLAFLDAADMRARLKALPIIKDANVTKLYPNRLAIEVEERAPAALWQKDGTLSLIAADGTPIDEMRDARFENLPLVVGDGANSRISEYAAILDAAGELRERIRAGLYVSGRRWTLKTDNGVDIDLPEIAPIDAVARLAKLEHDSHILEKDVLSLDIRIPGRVVARLSEESAAARADLAAKKKKKGAAT